MKTSKGYGQDELFPVGTIRVRERHRYGKISRRNFIKIAPGNRWMLNAFYVWNAHRGAVPKGMSIHHIDGNSLNDDINNLAAVSKAEHMSIHRHEFQAKATASFTETRRRLRWSTKKKI